MTKPSFELTSGISGTVQDGPEVSEVRIPLNGHNAKKAGAKKKAALGVGSPAGVHPDPNLGDMHCPIQGVVAEADDNAVVVKAAKADDEVEFPAVEKADLSGLAGNDLLDALKGLGVDVVELVGKASKIIINGLNPDPTITVCEQLLQDSRETLDKGLEAIRKIVSNPSVTLAVAEGSSYTLAGCTVAHVRPVYPNCIDALVVKAVTGQENPEGVMVVSVPTLYAVGRAMETGMPLTDAVMTVNGINYRVKVGTPMGAVLEHAGVKAEPGDTVVVGGAMRGTAVFSLDTGVGKSDLGLMVVPQGAFPPITEQACLNCGECVMHCPARIRPNMIARCAEFQKFELAQKWGIESCIECGLCGYHCVARRPMLQYIRLAKVELAAIEAEIAACAAQVEE